MFLRITLLKYKYCFFFCLFIIVESFFFNNLFAQINANNDTLYIGKGTIFRIDVLQNDIDHEDQRPVIINQPSKGIATTIVGSNEILFYPDADYDGTDHFTYRICDLNNNCSDAEVSIIKLPDNFIAQSNCSGAPPITNWDMKENWKQAVAGSQFFLSSPAAGDLDGDGIAEVIIFTGAGVNYNFQSANINVEVRRGTDGLLLASYPCAYSNNGQNMPTLVDLNKDGKGEIICFNSNRQLMALTFTRTSETTGILNPYKTASVVVTQDVANSYNVDVYDFNADGRTEVLVGPYIFNDNLELIAQAPFTTDGTGFVIQCNSRRAIAVDIDNCGNLEIIAGYNTYKVNIVDPDDLTKNSVTLLASSGKPDGFCAVADFDEDGDLDIVVVGPTKTYIWDGATSTIMGEEDHTTQYWVSVPLVSDVDGDGVLEIIYNRSNMTQCLRYSGQALLDKPWNIASKDIGGGTWMTAFDFNNDGASEMVYREDGGLRIIDGATLEVKKQVSVYSGTLTEGPIVVDVNGDGQAEILVTGSENSTHYIYCFSSQGDPWTYARPVWNQYMYSGVNINDNLTTPINQINPANVVYGDTLRPLNNFLQQHTLLGLSTGEPVSVTSLTDLTITEVDLISHISNNLRVNMKVTNLENETAVGPIPIALFANEGNGNYVFIDSKEIMSNISYAQVVEQELIFDVTNMNTNDYYFIINANSDVFPDNGLQEECNYDNNKARILLLRANPDYVSFLKEKGSVTIDVLNNDSLSNCFLSNISLTQTSNPQHGSVTITFNNQILYVLSQDYIGLDSFEYEIQCEDKISRTTVYITILDYPDNIINAVCFVDPKEFSWDIRNDYQSPNANHHNYAIPLIGDIDGDGIPEVITLNSTIQYLNILWGHNKSATTIKMAVNAIQDISSGGSICPYTMFKTKIDNVEKAIIVVKSSGNTLYAYDLNGPADQSSNPLWVASGGKYRENVSVADFDGDGIPEIYISDKIYNAHTGALLITGTGNVGRGSYDAHFSMAADVNGDGKLELLVGSEVYAVNIPNKAGTSGNSLDLIAKLKDDVTFTSGVPASDGITVVADINQDGKLDVVYLSAEVPVNISGNRMLIAWDVETESLICRSDEIYTSKNSGIPFIGNIDDDNALEVVFMIQNQLVGFKPDLLDKKFVKAYVTSVNDESGCTGMTIFDFNDDNKGEIVYRDQTKLRILRAIPGSPGTFSNIKDIDCTSTTSFEYPVIADIDNDGASEIIVVGNTSGYVGNGYLWIYKSGTVNPWAPARKVWNQYAYNAVNVNDDLTIPKVQFPPATLFPGKNGILGDSDDVRPFNAFLQQQTILNKNGTPLFLVPDIEWNSDPVFNYYADGDSMIFNISMGNTGDAGLQAPVYISVYKNSVEESNLVTTISCPNTVNVGDVVQLSVPVKNFTTIFPLSELIIRLNDRGNAMFYQQECDTLNNTRTIKLSSSGFDDYYGVYNDASGITSNFNILGNDISGLTQMTTIVSMASSAGSVISVNSGAIESLYYQPTANFTGIDTIKYISSGLTGMNIPVYVYGSAYIYVYSNQARYCYELSGNYPSIRIEDTDYDVTVDWKYSLDGSDANNLSTSSFYGPVDFGLEAEVTFNVSTIPVSAFNNAIVTPFILEVVPLQMYWNKSASNNNWNDPDNWVDGNGISMHAVPLSCTSVHIPGDADNYPSLDSLSTPRTVYYDSPECDSIVFHFGAEVARPNYLTYSKAFIQYNFGYYSGGYNYQDDGDSFSASAMDRGRWYALSAPLKKMVTGDFSLGGKPNTWQKGFVRSESSGNFIGEWVSPSNDNAMPLDESMAYSVSLWVGEYLSGVVGEGEGYQEGLNNLKGIIEIPYFENNILSDYHRIHHYDGTSSLFDYYYFEIPGVPIEPSQLQGSITRGDESYRFIFDGEIVRVPEGSDQGKEAFKLRVPAGSELMVGNPFLSSLDFRKFYEANSTKIEDYYRLYVNNVWEEYSYTLGSQALDEYIAPLQAFFITTSGSSSGSVDLYFPFESVSVTRPSGKALQLKNLEPGLSDVFYVTARNLDTGESNSVSLGLGKITGDEALKLFYGESEGSAVPQLYLGEGSNRKAIGIIDDAMEEISLGLRGANGANIAFEFSNIDRLHVDALFLFDKQEQVFTNLLEETSYRFQNTGDGTYQDRFMLIKKHSDYTSINPLEPALKKVTVYVAERILYIHSDNRVESVEIYNTQGVKIYSRGGINNRSFTEYLALPQGIYLVKVKLIDGKEEIEKIIIK